MPAEGLLTSFSSLPSCSVVQMLEYSERCAYIRGSTNCNRTGSLANYIEILYCDLKPQNDTEQILCSILLMTICILIYIVLGCTVENFFCPALKVVSKMLGLNEHLAGVTLLAFGNGSPDLIGTFSNLGGGGPMFPDLFGAGVYVMLLVAGLIFVFYPFELQWNNVLRDACFLSFGIIYVDYCCVSDGVVTRTEAILIMSVYILYLMVIFIEQFLLKQSVKLLQSKLKDRKYATAANLSKLEQLRAEAGIEILDRTSRVSIDINRTRTMSFDAILNKPNKDLVKQFLQSLNPIQTVEWVESGTAGKVYLIITAPVLFLLQLFIPVVDYEHDRHGWSKLLNSFQIPWVPLIIIYTLASNVFLFGIPLCCYTLLVTIPITGYMLYTTRTDIPPNYHHIPFRPLVVFLYMKRFVPNHLYFNNNDGGRLLSEEALTDFQSKSNKFRQSSDDPALPLNSYITEYRRQFRNRYITVKTILLRRSTSLHLEGYMRNTSEHQEEFQWYSHEDCKLCRAYAIKKPQNLFINGDIEMEPEYRSSYISHPMVDRTTKILPREAFRLDEYPIEKNVQPRHTETSTRRNLSEAKPKHELATRNFHKCHLQQLSIEAKYNTAPSEYKRQYVEFPIEKARSIPQICNLKIQGKFGGVPEYQDSFKIYENYSKSAPIKKADNLRMSGAEKLEEESNGSRNVPEYNEKFSNPPKNVSREKPLKTDDHLYPNGQFSKDRPEYYDSFQDPQIKHMPERGKCREPYLRLKGKIEFNPEYRNTFLDFPRARPVIRKPDSTFRLPNSSNISKTATNKSPKQSPREKCSSYLPNTDHFCKALLPTSDIITTPEYRRANYQYQLRERTPIRNSISKVDARRESNVSIAKQRNNTMPSPHTSRHREESTGYHKNFIECATKNAPKFGRRASMLPNSSDSCKEWTAFSSSDRQNHDKSFVVLNAECKPKNWMKKSWYES